MTSKLLAAQKAWSHGIPTTIVQGNLDRVLSRLVNQEEIGTVVGQR